MSRPFYTLDVFTDAALAGNPLAVVLEADDLDPARMQAIAREFALSETVFVMQPRDAINSARVRIFTPAHELPFAGHPTVGTAVLLAQLRAPGILARQDLALVIEETVGPVSCIARKVKGVSRASFTLPRLPERAGDPPSDDAIAAALGLTLEDIGCAGQRPSVFSAGVPFLFVPVTDVAVAGRARPDPSRWGEMGDLGVFVYCTAQAPDVDVHARMFAPGFGIAEDPATGSAAASFAGIVMHYGDLADGDHTIMIEQGVEMGRPSLMTLGLEVEDGALTSASIGGAAVVVSQGTLHL